MRDPRIARNRKEVEIIQGNGKKIRMLQRRKKKRMERIVIEMQLHMNKKEEDKAIKKLKVKLPKLVITRFNGTHINSFRFWNQFKREIKV